MQSYEWIRISDRLPPQDTSILVAKFDNRPKVKMFFIMIASRMGQKWFDNHNMEELDPKYGVVTHWMPLPDEPNKGEDQ